MFSPVSLGMGKTIESPSWVSGEGQLCAKHSGLVTGTQSTRRKLLVLMNIILKQMLAIFSFLFFWKRTHAPVVFIARLAFISTLLLLALPPAPHPCPRPAHASAPRAPVSSFYCTTCLPASLHSWSICLFISIGNKGFYLRTNIKETSFLLQYIKTFNVYADSLSCLGNVF